jgi:hypothetical protein
MQSQTGQATTPAPEPLTRAELEPLWRRERQAGLLQIAAMAGFLLAGVVAHRGGAVAWLASPLVAGALVPLGAGALLQVSLRCPRCRTWLRGKLLRMLPDRCPHCHVGFPRQPSAG